MRVIIAEDEVLLREGIARILADEGYDVVALAGSRDELVGKVAAHRPDLVVTDIRMPPDFTDEGLVAARQIRRAHPGTAVIVLSQHVDTAGAVELLGDGAAGVGYLLKRRVMKLDDFIDSVQRVAAGGSAIDPEVISAMVHREVRDRRDDGIAALTPRRLEVLGLMAQGWQRADRPRAGGDREGGCPQHRIDLPDAGPAAGPGRAPAGAGRHALSEPGSLTEFSRG